MTMSGAHPAVKRLRLSPARPASYDWPGTAIWESSWRDAALELTPSVARYEQIGRDMLRRIQGDEFPVGAKLPGAPALAREYQVSQGVGQRALEWLEARGIVRSEHGRGSEVLPRRPYSVRISIQPTGPVQKHRAAADELDTELGRASSSEPVIRVLHVTTGSEPVTVELIIETSGAGYAAVQAMVLLEQVCATGWDLAGATVESRPAAG